MSETLIYIMIIAFNCLTVFSQNIRQCSTDLKTTRTFSMIDIFRFIPRDFFLKAQSITPTRSEYYLIGLVMQSISTKPQMMILFE